MHQTNEIIEKVRGMQQELYEKYHVTRIGIFGSFSQGGQTEKSDLDLVVEFERPIGMMAFVHLKKQIAERIGIQVDLVTPDGLHPLIRNAVMREVIYV
jgi:predicted nucleotidyltransferase